MSIDRRDILAVLKSELTFLEQGGYARQTAASWWPPLIFEDSPACPNYNDRSRPHACSDCALIHLVPESQRSQAIPCRQIPITMEGESIEDLYRCGTQRELESALAQWLRFRIAEIELQRSMRGSRTFAYKYSRLLPAPAAK